MANSAYVFSSLNASSIDVPAATVNNLTNGTIAAWVELDGNTNEVIFGKQDDYVNSYAIFSVGCYVNSGGGYQSGTPGQLYFHAVNSTPVIVSSNFLSTGIWYQLAVVFSRTNCMLYINGVPSATTNGNFSVPNDLAATGTSIGAWESGPNPTTYFDGTIDEVRIYNRSLSPGEVAEMYQLSYSNLPRIATASAIVTNGFMVGVNITDPGMGYTNTPLVRIIGGVGNGAQAVAIVTNGIVTGIKCYKPWFWLYGYPASSY